MKHLPGSPLWECMTNHHVTSCALTSHGEAILIILSVLLAICAIWTLIGDLK